MLSPSTRYHAVFKVAAFINFWAKVMLFSCLQAYMTALNSFEKLKIDIIIYFRMFSFSNDLKKYKKSHSAILIFGQLWLESGPLCDVSCWVYSASSFCKLFLMYITLSVFMFFKWTGYIWINVKHCTSGNETIGKTQCM